MRVAVVGAEGGGLLQALAEDGTPQGPPEPVRDLAAAVTDWERAGRPRWVWAATAELYPGLLRAGVPGRPLPRPRPDRGDPARPPTAAGASRARSRPPGRACGACRSPTTRPGRPGGGAGPGSRPCSTTTCSASPTRPSCSSGWWPSTPTSSGAWPTGPPRVGCGLLVAAESAGALAAVEMAAAGLPWRAEVHDAAAHRAARAATAGPGRPPRRLTDLADRVAGRLRRPAAQPRLARRGAAGLRQRRHRRCPRPASWVLRAVDHPAVPLLLAYKELSAAARRPRLVVAGRLGAPAGGSGPSTCPAAWCRAAGRPAAAARCRSRTPLRRAVVADPGWTFVVADAGQLEPRVLAALSGDRRLARAAAGGDLYAAPGRRRLRRRPGPGQDRPCWRAMYGGDRRRGRPAAGGAAAALPGRRRLRRGRRPHRRGGRAGPVPARPDLPAALGRLAGGRPRLGRRDRPDADAAARGRRAAGTGAASPATSSSRPAPPTGRWSLLAAAARRRLAASGRRRAGLLPARRGDRALPRATQADRSRPRSARPPPRRPRWSSATPPVRFPLSVAVVDCYADAK